MTDREPISETCCICRGPLCAASADETGRAHDYCAGEELATVKDRYVPNYLNHPTR